MYSAAAEAFKRWGWFSFRVAGRNYLQVPGARDYPSPVRWGWAVLVRGLRWPGQTFAVMLTLLSGVASPLALAQSRTLLQDGAVACATVGAVLAARAHSPATLALCTCFGMCLKPEALLGIAAGALAAWWTPDSAWALACGGVAWASAMSGIFGGHLSWRLTRALFQKHDHVYGRTHQRGMPHRLLVDLCMVAPFAVLLGPWPREALAIVAVHALSPVRNVRTIIGAEVLLRMAFVQAAPWWLVVPSFAYDVWLWRKLRPVYDPVTDELRKAVCT
jgi:hypothetical protein